MESVKNLTLPVIFNGWCGLWLVVLAATLMVAGCNSQPAAATNLRLTEEEQRARLVLNRSQQRQVRAALTAVAEGHQPVDPPSAAQKGVRWSDVEPALRMACNEMEMAVFGRSIEEDRIVFRLRTVDDRPGTFIIRRTGDDQVYEAEATVGRFRDDTMMAAKLLDAFDEAMRTFGAKRRVKSPYD